MPQPISVEDFHYHLPQSSIALYPCASRDQSQLLFYHKGQITHHIFQEISSLLPPESLLVRNNSAVIPCRLFFPYTTAQGTAKRLECFILSSPGDPNWQNLHSPLISKLSLDCYLRPFYPELLNDRVLQLTLNIRGQKVQLAARVLARTAQSTRLEFCWNQGYSFAELLDHCAFTPLPPYIKREATALDRERYQNIYAAAPGSVAAPTAGLHFSPQVLEKLAQNQIHQLDLCLHVNLDTFKPMRGQFLHEHLMHGEYFQISRQNLQTILDAKTVIAVGTTVMRALESCYYLGCKTYANQANLQVLEQSEIAKLPKLPPKQALAQLIDHLEQSQQEFLESKTFLFIHPPRQIQLSQGLITNFHQPGSTLLALCASFIGADWRKIYQHALSHNYRFLSYGDSSLLIP